VFAKAAEYRAIFGAAGADLRLLGALQMKISSHIANRRDGCTIHAVLEVKKKIPKETGLRQKPAIPLRRVYNRRRFWS
jgi:hypothetical protein